MSSEKRGVERPPEIGDADAGKRAFKRFVKQMDALPREALRPGKVDVTRAVSVALVAAPRIAALAEELQKWLPLFPLTHVEDLEELALAAWYAHVLVDPRRGEAEALRKLAIEALPLERRLMIEAKLLAERGLLDATRVRNIPAGPGPRQLAKQLGGLSRIYRESWEALAPKTTVREPELERAAEIAAEISGTLAERDRARRFGGPRAGETRMRAFILLERTYDEIRRAVTYLRWHHGDLDQIAPPLSTRASGRSRPGPRA